MRIGIGYDVHKLVKGKKLVVGGVKIPHDKGLLGWSDADVLVHAVIDAILGALGERDIGKHFPPGDIKFKNISSLKLVEYVRELLRRSGYAINNLDSTIVGEAPRFAPYISEMIKNIASALDIPENLVNVKAKSEEGLGFTGTKRGLKAYAICLIHKEV